MFVSVDDTGILARVECILMPLRVVKVNIAIFPGNYPPPKQCVYIYIYISSYIASPKIKATNINTTTSTMKNHESTSGINHHGNLKGAPPMPPTTPPEIHKALI